jgi:hypothetical protein
VGQQIQRFVRALLSSLRRLQTLVHRLGEILTDLKALLARLARAIPLRHRGGAGDPLAPKPREAYRYNMADDPGPLADMRGTPAANFAGGRYDEVTLPADRVLYRGGDSQGSPLGQWFSTDPPQSVAHVRIDTA